MAEDGEVIDIPSGLILHGPEGLKQTLLAFSMTFPDSRIELTHIGATEDHAVVEFIVRGTHTGVLHTPAGDIPPTGRTFEMHLCDAYQIRNRKITRHASYYDALGLMQQLGVIPVA